MLRSTVFGATAFGPPPAGPGRALRGDKAVRYRAWAAWSAASVGWSVAPRYSAGELWTEVLALGIGAAAILL